MTFKIPDFVDIAVNAGDSRKAFGATIGQSLPNFGPVANEGRGRTVAMTNFYGDPDSLATAKAQAESLFCKDVMAKWSDERDAQRDVRGWRERDLCLTQRGRPKHLRHHGGQRVGVLGV